MRKMQIKHSQEWHQAANKDNLKINYYKEENQITATKKPHQKAHTNPQ